MHSGTAHSLYMISNERSATWHDGCRSRQVCTYPPEEHPLHRIYQCHSAHPPDQHRRHRALPLRSQPHAHRRAESERMNPSSSVQRSSWSCWKPSAVAAVVTSRPPGGLPVPGSGRAEVAGPGDTPAQARMIRWWRAGRAPPVPQCPPARNRERLTITSGRRGRDRDVTIFCDWLPTAPRSRAGSEQVASSALSAVPRGNIRGLRRSRGGACWDLKSMQHARLGRETETHAAKRCSPTPRGANFFHGRILLGLPSC